MIILNFTYPLIPEQIAQIEALTAPADAGAGQPIAATVEVPAQAADWLAIPPKTVAAHKAVIPAECRIAWNLAEGEWLTYHWLREKFGRYFDGLGVG